MFSTEVINKKQQLLNVADMLAWTCKIIGYTQKVQLLAHKTAIYTTLYTYYIVHAHVDGIRTTFMQN